jgi:hypothetical protein
MIYYPAPTIVHLLVPSETIVLNPYAALIVAVVAPLIVSDPALVITKVLVPVTDPDSSAIVICVPPGRAFAAGRVTMRLADMVPV